MRPFKIPGSKPLAQTQGFTKVEKRRLGLLLLATVFVTVAVGASLMKAKGTTDDGLDVPQQGGAISESVAVPTIDPERFDALVSDATPDERVVLETAAVDAMVGVARTLTDRHFELLGRTVLDASVAAVLDADPAAARGQAFTARGWVDSLRTRQRAGREEFVGTLILDDGTTTYFLVLDKPEQTNVGSYARIDGLFLKMFNDEAAESDAWVEGPFLVGPRAVRSYPAFGEVTELGLSHLAGLEDDRLYDETGRPVEWEGIPYEALWNVMAYARDLPAGAIDWDSTRVLDQDAMLSINSDGRSHRGEAFRIPISRLQAVQVLRAEENPARIDTITAGWIGNTTWNDVIHFQSPHAFRDLRLRDYVIGRGFFVKNFAYPSAKQGLRISPLFVIESLEEFEPEQDRTLMFLAYCMGGFTIFTILLFVVLLRRDRKRSIALQSELVKRRRKRRQGEGSEGSIGTASS